MNQVNKNRKRGKATESSLAKRMSAKRVGIYGGEDLKHDTWSIEVKNREKCVATGWMTQAIRNCDIFKMPMVILHINGARHDTDLVMVRLKDWEDMYGKFSSGGSNNDN